MTMKIMLLLVAMLSCLSIQAHAQGCGSNWLGNDAVGYDPDFNYAARHQGYASTSTIDLDVPSTKPRLAPDEQPKAFGSPSGPNMRMPDPSPKPLAKANATDNQTINQSTGNVTLPSQVAMPIDISGKWVIKLDGISKGIINLFLIQQNNTITGLGTVAENGTNLQVTAKGTLMEDELKMIVKTVVAEFINSIDKRYSFDLFLANNTTSGSYDLSSGEQILGKGNATAIGA